MVEVKEYKIVYYTHIRATHKRASSKPLTRNKKRTEAKSNKGVLERSEKAPHPGLFKCLSEASCLSR
jgi:hypothetical protein